jgi:hypothetical protein
MINGKDRTFEPDNSGYVAGVYVDGLVVAFTESCSEDTATCPGFGDALEKVVGTNMIHVDVMRRGVLCK